MSQTNLNKRQRALSRFVNDAIPGELMALTLLACGRMGLLLMEDAEASLLTLGDNPSDSRRARVTSAVFSKIATRARVACNDHSPQ